MYWKTNKFIISVSLSNIASFIILFPPYMYITCIHPAADPPPQKKKKKKRCIPFCIRMLKGEASPIIYADWVNGK